jgi:ribose transport system substrate-binding protein
MRKLTALLAVGVTALGVAACGSSSSKSASGGTAAKKAYNIALITNDQFDPFYMTMNAGAQDDAKKLGINVKWSAPATADLPSQTAVLQSVIARHPDGIIMSAVDGRGMVAPIRQAEAQGIPVITLDSDIADKSARLAYIGSNNVEAGKVAAETMAKLIGKGGKVAYEGYVPGIQSVDAREQGWTQELSAVGLTQVGKTYDKGDLKDVAANVNGLLRRNSNLQGIFASWTNPVIGSANALQNAGKAGKVRLVGLDASPDQVALLRRGLVSALVVQKVYTMGQLGVQEMVHYLETKQKPQDKLLNFVVATRSNVDQPGVKQFLYRKAGK